MERLQRELIERKEWLEQIKNDIETNLISVPEGKLRIINKKGIRQYYVKNKDNSKTNPQGKYIKKKDSKIANLIAQRDYDESSLKKVKKELCAINNLLSNYNAGTLENEYTCLSKYRKEIVVPWVKDTEEYIKEWQQVEYPTKEFWEEEKKIFTERGECVRSKSEKIIADKLFMKGIPYRYEYPLKLKGFNAVFPDFMCLKVSERKEIYWEHMGMMGNADYSKTAIKKINSYIKNGYRYGENIIFTFESAETPLDTAVIDKLIDTYLI